MALFYKQIRFIFFDYLPIIFLFLVALSGNSIIDLKYISINIHYILVYYWVLRHPDLMGYGFIFLSGIIGDVIYGYPLGVLALTLLIVASVAAYARVVTVRMTLINDWITFIPALLVANFAYFIALYFSDFSIDYLLIFKNSVFTLIFYPALWVFFALISKLRRS